MATDDGPRPQSSSNSRVSSRNASHDKRGHSSGGSSTKSRPKSKAKSKSKSKTTSKSARTSKRPLDPGTRPTDRCDKLREATEADQGYPLEAIDCANSAVCHRKALPFKGILALNIPIRSPGRRPNGKGVPLVPTDELLGDMARDNGSTGLKFAVMLIVFGYLCRNIANAHKLLKDNPSASVPYGRMRDITGSLDVMRELEITKCAANAPTDDEARNIVMGGVYSQYSGESGDDSEDMECIDEEYDALHDHWAFMCPVNEDPRMGTGRGPGSRPNRKRPRSGENDTHRKRGRRLSRDTVVEDAVPIRIILEYTHAKSKDVRAAESLSTAAASDTVDGYESGSQSGEGEEELSCIKESTVDEDELKATFERRVDALGLKGTAKEEVLRKIMSTRRNTLASRRRMSSSSPLLKTVMDRSMEKGASLDSLSSPDDPDTPRPVPWRLQEGGKLVDDTKEDVALKALSVHLREARDVLDKIKAVGDMLSEIAGGEDSTHAMVSADTIAEHLLEEERCSARVKALEDLCRSEGTGVDNVVPGTSPFTGTYAEEVTGVTIYVLNCTDIAVQDVLLELIREHSAERASRNTGLSAEWFRAHAQNMFSGEGHTPTQPVVYDECAGRSGNEEVLDSIARGRHVDVDHIRSRVTFTTAGGSGQQTQRRRPASSSGATARLRSASERAKKRTGSYAAGKIDHSNWMEVASEYAGLDAKKYQNMDSLQLEKEISSGKLHPESVFSLTNAFKHRDGLCAPAQSLSRFRATSGHVISVGGPGARDENGYGYVYFRMPVSVQPTTCLEKEDFMISIGIPRPRSICPPPAVLRVMTPDQRSALGLGADGMPVTKDANTVRTQDPYALERAFFMQSTKDCAIVDAARILASCVERMWLHCQGSVKNGLISEAAALAIMEGTRAWATSTMARMMNSRDRENSPGLRCIFFAFEEGVLSKNAPPVRDRMTAPEHLEDLEDFVAASVMDLSQWMFSSLPFIVDNGFKCLNTGFEIDAKTPCHMMATGPPGSGKTELFSYIRDLSNPEVHIPVPGGVETCPVVRYVDDWSPQMWTADRLRHGGGIVIHEEVPVRNFTENASFYKKVLDVDTLSRPSAHVFSQTGGRCVIENQCIVRFTYGATCNDNYAAKAPDAIIERLPSCQISVKDSIASDCTSVDIARREALQTKPEYIENAELIKLSYRYLQGFTVAMYLLQTARAVPRINITVTWIVLSGMDAMLRASGVKGLVVRARKYIARLAGTYAMQRILVRGWMRPGAPYENRAVLPERIGKLARLYGIVPTVEDTVRAIGFYLHFTGTLATNEVCAGITLHIMETIKGSLEVAETNGVLVMGNKFTLHGSQPGTLDDDDDDIHLYDCIDSGDESTTMSTEYGTALGHGLPPPPPPPPMQSHVDISSPANRILGKQAHTTDVNQHSTAMKEKTDQEARESLRKALADRTRVEAIFNVVRVLCPLRKGRQHPKDTEQRDSIAKIQQLYDTDYVILANNTTVAQDIIRKTLEERDRFVAERYSATGDSTYHRSETLSAVEGYGLYAGERPFRPNCMPTANGVQAWFGDVVKTGKYEAPRYTLMEEDPTGIPGCISQIFTVREGDEAVLASAAYKINDAHIAVRLSYILNHVSKEEIMTRALQAFLNTSAVEPRLVPFYPGPKGTLYHLPMGSGYAPGARTKEDHNPDDPDGKEPCKFLDVYSDYSSEVNRQAVMKERSDTEDSHGSTGAFEDHHEIDDECTLRRKVETIATRYKSIEAARVGDDSDRLASVLLNDIAEYREEPEQRDTGATTTTSEDVPCITIESFDTRHRQYCTEETPVPSSPVLEGDIVLAMQYGDIWMGASTDAMKDLPNADALMESAKLAYRVFDHEPSPDETKPPIDTAMLPLVATEYVAEHDFRVKAPFTSDPIASLRSPNRSNNADRVPFWTRLFAVDFSTYIKTIRNTSLDDRRQSEYRRQMVAKQCDAQVSHARHAVCTTTRPVYPDAFIENAFRSAKEAVRHNKNLQKKMRMTTDGSNSGAYHVPSPLHTSSSSVSNMSSRGSSVSRDTVSTCGSSASPGYSTTPDRMDFLSASLPSLRLDEIDSMSSIEDRTNDTEEEFQRVFPGGIRRVTQTRDQPPATTNRDFMRKSSATVPREPLPIRKRESRRSRKKKKTQRRCDSSSSSSSSSGSDCSGSMSSLSTFDEF